MFVATVFGFVLNIVSSYRYARISAAMLFDMRLALFQHLQKLSPRFLARTKLGEIVSRINNDVAEIQRVAADTLLALIGNVVFLTTAMVEAGRLRIADWREQRLQPALGSGASR